MKIDKKLVALIGILVFGLAFYSADQFGKGRSDKSDMSLKEHIAKR